MAYIIETTEPAGDYELLDSGEGYKLERYGSVFLARPDPQALWPKQKPEEWEKAQAKFEQTEKGGNWIIKPGVPGKWQISFGGLSFAIRPSAFKHTGLFPEQLAQWKWMQEKIKTAGRPISVLNLFGYTGGATLACAQAGVDVCHVDGSKSAISWGNENAEASGLAEKPIRWIPDDALAFVKREIKRGKKYDAIIMDPPTFGRGPKGEVWKIEEDFLTLIENSKQLLTDAPLFFVVNGYAAGYSALAYENALATVTKDLGGKIESGELTIKESGKGGRLLPAGIFARWSK